MWLAKALMMNSNNKEFRFNPTATSKKEKLLGILSDVDATICQHYDNIKTTI